ncbi:hypothetical protein MSZK_08930 [Mycobacterium sp. shizuoka-1]|nr:hypothetical protein MSZK_08930 [Mycobacterium sp. shizuoka-1]
MAGIRGARNPAVGIREARNPAVGSPVGRSRVVDSPAAGNPPADSREQSHTVAGRAAGMAIDQAIRAGVQVALREVPSPDSAPDVVAHEPILAIGGVFLNVSSVPPVGGA